MDSGVILVLRMRRGMCEPKDLDLQERRQATLGPEVKTSSDLRCGSLPRETSCHGATLPWSNHGMEQSSL